MPHQRLLPGPAFQPVYQELPPLGTNGHISSWGANLAGTPPASADT